MSVFHTGGLLSALACLTLWIIAGDGRSRRSTAIILSLSAVVAFATSLSDALSLVQLAAPLATAEICVSLINRKIDAARSIFAVSVAASSLAGVSAYPHVVTFPSRMPFVLSLDQIPGKLQALSSIIGAHPVPSLVVGACYLLCLLYLDAGRSVPDGRLFRLCMFALLSAITALASLLVNASVMVDDRYLLATALFPLAIGPAAALAIAPVLTRASLIGGLSLCTTAIILLCASLTSLGKPILDLYTPQMACIDEALKRHDAHAGVTGYWQAKLHQAFSRDDLRIAQYFNDMRPLKHVTPDRYYTDDYDFAILSRMAMDAPEMRINEADVIRINGAPAWTQNCGELKIIGYATGQMHMIARTAVSAKP